MLPIDRKVAQPLRARTPVVHRRETVVSLLTSCVPAQASGILKQAAFANNSCGTGPERTKSRT